MNNQKLLLSLTALMLACTPFVVADGANDGICDGDEGPGSPPGSNGRDNEGADIQCAIIAGPATLTVKSVLTVGVGFCQTETTDIPLQCEGQAGAVNGAGAATFGDANWTGKRQINVEVTHDQETCTDVTRPPCGFTVEICNDRDQDSTCTNILANNDELHDTASSEGILYDTTNGSVGKGCKDEKTFCDDPNKASWEGCMNPSIFDDDWSDDQIIIFIGVEVGPANLPEIDLDDPEQTAMNVANWIADLKPDAQAAIVVGTFTIFVEDKQLPVPDDCPVVPPIVDSEPILCEADWTVGAPDGSADNPFNGATCTNGGICTDDYAGNGYNPATGGQMTVVVTCVAMNACEPVGVETFANLVQGAASVKTEVKCDGGVIASSMDATSDGIPDIDWGNKTSGDYECIFTFVITMVPYHAEGACRDKPTPPACSGYVDPLYPVSTCRIPCTVGGQATGVVVVTATNVDDTVGTITTTAAGPCVAGGSVTATDPGMPVNTAATVAGAFITCTVTSTGGATGIGTCSEP